MAQAWMLSLRTCSSASVLKHCDAAYGKSCWRKQTRAAAISLGRPRVAERCGRAAVRCAGKSPEDFTQSEGENEDTGFVAPRVTPDYVAKDSIKPPPRVVKNMEGPWITRWGGNVRAGKYQMGQGTDRIIEIFANGNAMLIAAGGLLVLFFILLQFRPPPPS